MTNLPANAETDEASAREQRRAREAASETRAAAIRAGAIWIPVGPILCVVLLAALKKPLISAQELATEQAGFPTEPMMPLALFAAVGACYGAFVAWRVTNSSGAVGRPVLMIVAIGLLATLVGGAIGALFIFEAGIPGFAWLAILAMTVVGLFTAWLVNHALG